MLTWNEDKRIMTDSTYYEQGECLSTDEKPTDGVANGSILKELDTSTLYFYDAENHVWRAWT